MATAVKEGKIHDQLLVDDREENSVEGADEKADPILKDEAKHKLMEEAKEDSDMNMNGSDSEEMSFDILKVISQEIKNDPLPMLDNCLK